MLVVLEVTDLVLLLVVHYTTVEQLLLLLDKVLVKLHPSMFQLTLLVLLLLSMQDLVDLLDHGLEHLLLL